MEEREREQIIFWTTAPTTTKSDAFLDRKMDPYIERGLRFFFRHQHFILSLLSFGPDSQSLLLLNVWKVTDSHTLISIISLQSLLVEKETPKATLSTPD